MNEYISRLIPDEINEYHTQYSDRMLHPKIKKITQFFCLFYLAFHLFALSTDFISNYYQAIIHITALGILTYILYPINNHKYNRKILIFEHYIYTIIGTAATGYFFFLFLNVSELYFNLMICFLFLFLYYLKKRDFLKENVLHELDALLSCIGLLLVGFVLYFLLSENVFLKFNIDPALKNWIIIFLSILACIFIIQIINSFLYFKHPIKTAFYEFSLPFTDRIFLLIIIYICSFFLFEGLGPCYSGDMIDKYLVFEGIFCLMILEAIRRVLGSFLASAIIILFFYSIFGHLLGKFVVIEYFSHEGISLNRLLHSFFCEEGKAFAFPFSATYQYIFLFTVSFVMVFQSGLLNNILQVLANVFKWNSFQFQLPYWIVTFTNNLFGNYIVTPHTQIEIKMPSYAAPSHDQETESINISMNIISQLSLPFIGLLAFIVIQQSQELISISQLVIVFAFISVLVWIFGISILYLWKKEKHFNLFYKIEKLSSQDKFSDAILLIYPLILIALIALEKPFTIFSYLSFTYIIILYINRRSNNFFLPIIIISLPLTLLNPLSNIYLSPIFFVAVLLALLILIMNLREKKGFFIGRYIIIFLIAIAFGIFIKSPFALGSVLLYSSIVIYFILNKDSDEFSKFMDDIYISFKLYLPICLGCMGVTFISFLFFNTQLNEKLAVLLSDIFTKIFILISNFNFLRLIGIQSVLFFTVILLFLSIISYFICLNLSLIPRFLLLWLCIHPVLIKLKYSVMDISIIVTALAVIIPIYSVFKPVIFNRFSRLSLPKIKTSVYLFKYILPFILLIISVIGSQKILYNYFVENDIITTFINLFLLIIAMIYYAIGIQKYLFEKIGSIDSYAFIILSITIFIFNVYVSSIAFIIGLILILIKRLSVKKRPIDNEYKFFYK